MSVGGVDPIAGLGGLASAASGLIAPFTSSLVSPYIRDAGYEANTNGPVAAPPPDAIIRAYYAGHWGKPTEALNSRELWRSLAEHGIADVSGLDVGQKRAGVWRRTVDLARPLPDFASYWRAWTRQLHGVTERDVLARLHRDGVWGDTEEAIFLQHTEWPGIDAIMLYYWGGGFGLPGTDAALTLLRQWLRGAGVTLGTAQDLLINAGKPITGFEAGQLLLRGVIGDDRYRQILQWNGVKDVQSQAEAAELLKVIPSPSDLIRFAVREVWDDATVRAFGYDEDFPEPFRIWAEKQGFGWGQQVTDANGVTYPAVPWPLAYWRAHWQTISPGQAYEMLHRLRPGRIERYRQFVPGVQPVDLAFVQRVLKVADYPLAFRDRLAAISYRPISYRQITKVVQAGLVDQAELAESFQDMGYSPPDSALLARAYATEPDAAEVKAEQRRARKCILDLYALGGTDSDTAGGQLIGAGATPQLARLSLARVDLCNRTATLKAAIAAIRKHVLRGELTLDGGAAELVNIGVQSARAQEYRALWAMELTPTRRRLSAGRIRQLVAKGLMDRDTAVSRLINLGWSQPDAVLDLSLAEQQFQHLLASEQKAAEKAVHSQAKAMEGLAKQHQAAAKRLVQAAVKMEPLSVLKRWLKKAIVDVNEFGRRLTARGYPAELIANYVQELTGERPDGQAIAQWGTPLAGPVTAGSPQTETGITPPVQS